MVAGQIDLNILRSGWEQSPGTEELYFQTNSFAGFPQGIVIALST